MARVLFPAFLDLVDRPVIVVGGGQVAASKIQSVLDAGARVTVVAPDVAPAIATMRVAIVQRTFEPGDLDGAAYVITAAPPTVNARVAREATARGIFVNAVDDPRHATAFAGSVVRRGPVTVALSTGGEAPALARLLREALERLITDDVEDWAALAARLRTDWRRTRMPMAARRDSLLAALAHVHCEQTRDMPHAPAGFVTIAGAGPGDPELLTRLAARRLVEADLVLYDALVSPAVVSLAAKAQRVMVGRRKGSSPIGQTAINRTLIRAARRGRHVVRLKGGDPFVFGRGGEEALALAEAGVPFEIVPGVSSAFAAPALAAIPVTHRGVSSSVLVTTGHDLDRFAQLATDVAPASVTLVVLMGSTVRGAIADLLIAAGWETDTPAAVIWSASRPDMTVWSGPLGKMHEADGPDDEPATLVVGEVVSIRAALTTAGLKPRATQQEARHG